MSLGTEGRVWSGSDALMGFWNKEEQLAVFVKPEEMRMQRRPPGHRDGVCLKVKKT